MPEPDKQIEELLRASAEARRADFGKEPAMPNPMRARLHDEIARQNASGVADERPHRSWLATWWPRLAIGGAVALVLIGAPLWRMNERKSGITTERAKIAFAPTQEQELNAPQATRESKETPPLFADKDTAPRGTAETTGTVETTPTSLPPVRLAEAQTQPMLDSENRKAGEELSKELDDKLPGSALTLQQSPPPPATVMPHESAGVKAKTEEPAKTQSESAPLLAGKATGGAAGMSSAADALTVTAPAAPSAPTTQPMQDAASAGKAREAKKDIAAQTAARAPRQQFQATSKLARSRPDVLANFEVEQSGDVIRIVDADGSTYSGRIHATRDESKSESQKQQSRETGTRRFSAAPASRATRAEPERSQTNASEFQFRATGSNRSLNKPVVFEGRYIVPQASTQDAQRLRKQSQAAPDARIIGRAQIKGGKEIEVDAVPVSSQ